MDLTRFGIKLDIKRNTSSYYSDIASLKSSSIFIENKAIGESINDFIQNKIMVMSSEDKKGVLGKIKKGAKDILNKIIAFFVAVKNFFVKKIKQVKEFFFGKKVENVKKKAEKFNKKTKNTNVPKNKVNERPMVLDQFFEFPEILVANSLEELKNKYEKTNAGEELLSVLKTFRTEVNSYLNEHRTAANKKDGGSTGRRQEAISKISDSFKNSFDKFQNSLDILKTISSKIDQNAKMVKMSFSKDREKIELTKANIGNTILLIDNIRKIVDVLEKDGIEDLNSTISKLNALKKVAIEQNYDWTSRYGDMYNRATKFVNHLMSNMNQMISLTNSIVTSLDIILAKNIIKLSDVSPDGYMKIDKRVF